jgi:hypothetical protein
MDHLIGRPSLQPYRLVAADAGDAKPCPAQPFHVSHVGIDHERVDAGKGEARRESTADRTGANAPN